MHPVLLTVFGYPIHYYALGIAAGFISAVWLGVRYGERMGLDREMILDLAWWLLVSGLVGSRVLFIVVGWEHYYWPCVDFEHYNQLFPTEAITEPDCWRLLRFWTGGLVFLGGPIAAVACMVWFLRREGVPFWPVADALIPGVALGQFFGRLGCLAAGCCWGRPSSVPWAIEFPRRSMAFQQHLDAGLIASQAGASLPVHPTQLYDSFVGLCIFLALIWIRQRKRFHGQAFLWWMLLYPIGRIGVELFRGDDVDRGFIFRWVSEPLNQALSLPAGSATFLSTSQAISLVIAAGALFVLLRRARTRASA